MGCGASAKKDGVADTKKSGGVSKKEVKDGGITKSNFITDNSDKKITDKYNLDKKKIGEGSYGSVSKCTNKTTQQICACKSISKAQMKNNERFKQEIAIMKIMDHPNIIKLYETFEDRQFFYLVMELATGGELFDRIIDSGHFTEVQAATVMQHIFRAIYYMHENHVCHRDLKPENFLFVSKDPIEKTLLKIIDFGLACEFSAGQVLSTKAGTPYYVAPQVLAGKYDQASDLWSCGVIMYVLLCGYPPFYGEQDADVLAKVRLGNFSFNQADWKSISEDAKNLIRHLLKMNPKDRCTAQGALKHVWIENKAPRAIVGGEVGGNMMAKLKGFRSQNKLKKAALQMIATQLGEKEISGLRDIFMALDSNQDGSLTAQEMKEGLAKAGFKEIPPDLAQILEDVDADGSGNIDYTEFLAATLDKKMYHKEEVCWTAFKAFDKDGDGKISKAEIAMVLGDDDVQKQAAAKDLEELMKEFDTNGDGEIDFQEFMQLMRGKDGK